MKFLRCFFLVLTFTYCGFGQSDEKPTPYFSLLPGGLHFAPLKANVQEARIGLFKFSNESTMRLDVGNSVDIAEYSLPASRVNITAGIDFFSYARSVGAEGFRLQIDALDGLFGGNFSISKQFDSTHILQTRLRLSHLSAHFVDGHFFDPESGMWIENRPPRVITRDFGELVIAHQTNHPFGQMRYYGGIAYATLVRPTDLQRFSYLAGFEAAFDNILHAIDEHPTNIFLVYQIDLRGTPAYSATHQLQLGIKLGEFYGKGTAFYLGYYTGQDMFMEYFDERISTVGVGFTVDWE